MRAGTRITDEPWIGSPGKKELDSLVAAAAPATTPGATNGVGAAGGNKDGWQAQAWQFYDTVGELRYVIQWIASALSRCTLVASDIGPDGHPTGFTEDQTVIDLVAEIAGGPAGQAAMLGRLATFLSVPGDGYVVILYQEGREEWHVLSREEVKKRADGKIEVLLANETVILDPDTDSVTRVCKPHPRNARETDSPVRAALPILREIIRLGQHIETTAKSRLVGAGILFVPNEMSLPPAEAPVAEPVDPDAPGLPPLSPEEEPTATHRATPADLSDAIIETASIAIEDPGSAAAATPIVVGVPADYIGKVQHFKFGLDWADTVLQLRTSAIHRLALAVDVPPEVLTGTGGMNHWGSWQVEESAIKIHIEPLLTLICDRLTDSLLRPVLEARGLGEHADNHCIWFETSRLTQRPNRGPEALNLWDRGLINDQVVVREHGYDPDADMPATPGQPPSGAPSQGYPQTPPGSRTEPEGRP